MDQKLRSTVWTDPEAHDALANAFGVHRRTVEKVLKGETWGHV